MGGLIHIYCGDGKGKTTAAAGLAVRAAGAGKRVLFAQFFKNGTSSEIAVLRSLPNVETEICEAPHGFFRDMDAPARERAKADYTALLDGVLARARDGVDVLILDEATSACKYRMISESALLDFLRTKPEGLEVVLTGRDPSAALLDAADYVTEMLKRKHPYDRGIQARRGIEY